MNVRQPHAIAIMTIAVALVACGGPQSDTDSGKPVAEGSVADGEALIQQGEYEAASQLFAKLVVDRPGSAKAHFYLGVCHENLEEARAAP